MVQPLSPRSEATLNSAAATPSLSERLKSTPVASQRHFSAESVSSVRSCNSSPFETEVGTDIGQGQENRPPISQAFSPLKDRSMAQLKSSPFSGFNIYDEATTTQPPLPSIMLSPTKSRIFRDSGSSIQPADIPLPPSSPFKENAEDDTIQQKPATTPSRRAQPYDDDETDTRSVASEDTCFSTFSAVPNADMTLFATLGNRTPGGAGRSPRKNHQRDQTPDTNVFMTPATSRHRQRDTSSRPGSPTPRKGKSASKDGDTTNLLLDFTNQFGAPSRRGQSPIKSTTEPNLLSYINNQRARSPVKAPPRTPGKRNMLNLLDFDLPPQPTPRSIPTITVRELESLKSSYLSEISSLKASLSGREAEAASLKKAVGDAERRVGEAQESLREERSAREDAEATKAEWEKKGKEVQSLLSKVREECMNEEREKADLLQKLDESNRAREEAELRAEAAASKASVAQQSDATTFDGRTSNPSATDAMVASRVAAQLDEKMENLARELHSVYKKKHEAKVATLKKTYEVRSDKKCHELQAKIEELSKHNDDLQAVKDSSLSLELASAGRRGPNPEGHEQYAAELQEQKATIAGLLQEMDTVRDTQSLLLEDLERERVEKGELVAAVDEMLALQSEVGAPSAMEDFRKSIGIGAGTPVAVSRPASGLARPGFGGESRIGRGGGGGTALPTRSTSGGASSGVSKSRMMSNIERMGNGRA